MKTAPLVVALAGQPNAGKSTVFNLLTGARQHVANYPGVTVEKKLGRARIGGVTLEVVDLPGTYSLTSWSLEERVARDFLLLERPDVIVIVADASNLERHLYLVFQLLEMRLPAVLCLNMMDVAERRGIRVDVGALTRKLGIEVVPLIATAGKGGEALRAAILAATGRRPGPEADAPVDYGPPMEAAVRDTVAEVDGVGWTAEHVPARWLALKLLEHDTEAQRMLTLHAGERAEDVLAAVEMRRQDLVGTRGGTPEKLIASARYRAAGQVMAACVERPAKALRTLTDRIDAVVLHRWLAPFILAAILFTFYQLAMIQGTNLSDWLFPYINAIKTSAQALLVSDDPIRAGLLESLIIDGLLGAVVEILYYVPMLFVLFALLAVLEDSGYMARMAFILDRVLRWFGLHGQSTLPLILGGVITGGCCVPGVMATRAIKDEKARLVTILIMPLMNCAAKLPFYMLIISLMVSGGGVLLVAGVAPVGPEWVQWLMTPFLWGGEESRWFRIALSYRALALFGLSVFSFFMAMVVAKVFSRYLVRGESAPFVMELPVYHVPTVRAALLRSLERVWLFVRKIITVVALVQVCVWFLVTFPGIGFEREAHFDREAAAVLQAAALEAPSPRAEKAKERALDRLRRERRREQIDASIAGWCGRALEPVSIHAGFEWRMNIAILASFAAKESMVGTLGTIYSVEGGDVSLADSVRRTETGWTIWHKLAILVFIALFPPCLATLIVVRNETASWGWMSFAAIYPILIGFVLAVMVFNVGPLLFPPVILACW